MKISEFGKWMRATLRSDGPWSRIVRCTREAPYFVRDVVRNYFEDDCPDRAGSLTYLSLFAVVPMLTLIYSMLSLVPAFSEVQSQIQNLIYEYFIPTADEDVKASLEQFSRQARNLTMLGIIFLATTAYLMLRNIEKTFNRIWRTRTNRQGLASFLLYWAVLSLGPLLIGIGFVISTYLVSLAVFFEEEGQIGMGRDVLAIMPVLLETATFTLLFAAVPNTRVSLWHATFGGLITAISFECAKKVFTTIVSHTSFTFIYGAFAALPLLLLWVYVGWLIILAGAEIVHAMGSFEARATRQQHPLLVTVGLLAKMHDRYRHGGAITDHDILATPWLLGRYRLSPRQWQVLRNQLLKSGMLQVTETQAYVLGRDLYATSLWELANSIVGAWRPLRISDLPISQEDANTPEWYDNIIDLLEEIDQNNHRVMNRSIAQVIAAEYPTA